MRVNALIVALTLLCATAAAQDDLSAFRASIDKKLKNHPFFTKIAFTVVDQHPPFLFYVQRPPRDVPLYERAIVNSYLPFLIELTKQCDEKYWQPSGLPRDPAAPGFAVAVLDSAGSYLNFRTAIGEPALAQARAHYTPELRLAVTYVDAFSSHNTNREERHALLHEFVHGLQHAYAKGGQMPKPVWYNEGLADYRSACYSGANSLIEPPVQMRHVRALGFGYGNPAGRFYIAPLTDLVSANSYQDVIEFATRRNNVELRTDVILPMFYSQAEMFVRFLHEANAGQFREGFLAYMKAAQNGEAGLEIFQRAFDCAAPEQLAALELEWLEWLDAQLRPTFPKMPSLNQAYAAAAGVAVPLPPPVEIEKKGLGFSVADFDERVAGARRLCVAGSYEAALTMLPGDSDELDAAQRELAQRERQRVAAIIELREEVIADYAERKGVMTVGADEARVRGRFVRREDAGIVLEVSKVEQVVPLDAMDPVTLIREGNRLKKFKGADRWLQIWLRWLQGDELSKLKRFLALDYDTMAPLRQDLTGDFDPAAGRGAEVLSSLQTLEPTDDPDEARRALSVLRAAIQGAGTSDLLQQRKTAIEALVRAYAERAFDPMDLAALGVSGEVERLGDGRVLVDYSGPDAPVGCDFTVVKSLEDSPMAMPDNKLIYDGPTGLVTIKGERQLIGSGQLAWALPLSGQQVVEFEFVAYNAGHWAVMLCTESGGCLYVTPMGEVVVLDEASGIQDSVVGDREALYLEKAYTLRIEHDGKKELTVKRNGKVVTRVPNTGARLRGELRLYVHASTGLAVKNLRISGKPDPLDLQPLRDRFVASVLERLWQ